MPADRPMIPIDALLDGFMISQGRVESQLLEARTTIKGQQATIEGLAEERDRALEPDPPRHVADVISWASKQHDWSQHLIACPAYASRELWDCTCGGSPTLAWLRSRLEEIESIERQVVEDSSGDCKD